MKASRPSPSGAVRAAVDEFDGLVRDAFGPAVLAHWIGGSLAMGDFDPATSDIDLAVVLDPRPPRRRLMQELEGLLARTRLSSNPWMQRLEVFFYSRRELGPHRARELSLLVPALEPGGSAPVLEEVGAEIFLYQHALREHGTTVFGIGPDELIPPVSRPALEVAVRWTAKRWVTGWVRQPEQLEAVQFRAFAIFTCCRMLYTLERGAIASKPAAARWAAALLSPSLSATVEAALAAKAGSGSPPSVDGVMALIRYTLARLGLDRSGAAAW